MVNMAEVCSTHKGLVYHIAKQYIKVCEYDRAIDIDDLAQAGYIGLMQAVQTYDESKSSFSTWAAIYIKLEMRKVLGITRRDQRADQGAASLDELIPGAEDITLLDTLEASDNTEGEYDHTELVDGVRGIVTTLAEPQRTLVQKHDLQGLSLVHAGQSCGLESSAVYRVHQQAMRRLRRDPRLRSLAKAHHLDQITDWHRHVGIQEYSSTWMSSTEAIAFWRERQQEKCQQATVGGELPSRVKPVREPYRGSGGCEYFSPNYADKRQTKSVQFSGNKKGTKWQQTTTYICLR